MSRRPRRSPLKLHPDQVLSQRAETPNETRFRLIGQPGWGVAIPAVLGWMLVWWAGLAGFGFWMWWWLVPGVALLAWATWLVWHPLGSPPQLAEIRGMALRTQSRLKVDTQATVTLPDTLFSATGAKLNVPTHWVGRVVQASPMHLDAEICVRDRMVVRLGRDLAIEREQRWRWIGRWRAQRALAIVHGLVALSLFLPLQSWQSHWQRAHGSFQALTAIPTPTLAQWLLKAPAVGELVHIKAQVRCPEQRAQSDDPTLFIRQLICSHRVWGDGDQAMLLKLSAPVEPKLDAVVTERFSLMGGGMEALPPQPFHEVGFFARVTGVDQIDGKPRLVHLDTHVNPSQANPSRLVVLSSFLSLLLALLHAGLGLMVLGHRRD